jgi:hypothetical protein
MLFSRRPGAALASTEASVPLRVSNHGTVRKARNFDAPGTAGVPRAACKSVTNCECAPAGTRCIEAPTKGAEKLLSMFVRISADEPVAIGHPHIGQSLGIQHVVVANDFV